MNLDGKVVWITGASSGIGAALARRMAAKGARLALSARREEKLAEVCSQCENPEAHFVMPLDLADAEGLEYAAERVL